MRRELSGSARVSVSENGEEEQEVRFIYSSSSSDSERGDALVSAEHAKSL